MLPFLLTTPINSRAMCGIERTLERASSTPPARYNNDEIKNHLFEVKSLLDALNTLRLSSEENASRVERGSPDGSHGATIVLAPKEGTSLCHT